MTKDEALKLALEAAEIGLANLTSYQSSGNSPTIHEYGQAARALAKVRAAKEALAKPPEERNFCPRCGKRAGKNDWDVHTCSPPEEKNT